MIYRRVTITHRTFCDDVCRDIDNIDMEKKHNDASTELDPKGSKQQN